MTINLRSLGLLIGILAFLGGLLWWQQRPDPIDEDQQAFLSGIAVQPEDVSKVTLATSSGQLIFVNTGNDWMVDEEYQADGERLNTLVRQLTSPDASDVTLVSETSELHESLGVDSGSAVRVELSALGDESPHMFLVGMNERGGRYVRLEGTDAVFLIGDIDRDIESTALNDWVSMSLTGVTESEVVELSYQSAETVIDLSNQDGQWYFNNQAVMRSSIADFLNGLFSLEAREFFTTRPVEYEAGEQLTLELDTGDDVSPQQLYFYERSNEDGDVLVEVGDREGFYIIAGASFDSLALTAEQIEFDTSDSES